MTRAEILRWLRERSETALAELWRRADETRRECVGDAVHLRGLVEVSNYCARRCFYCGIRADNRGLRRYRLEHDEILAAAREAQSLGYGTLVLQAGEDPGLTETFVADVIRSVKTETPLAVTLSLGERSVSELKTWREAGADRYLLRFETSNLALFDAYHPPLPGERRSRIALLNTLRVLGYEVGSGVMIGLPGQSYDDLTNDIELFRELDLDMIGVGPFIPHAETPLGQTPQMADDQVPATEEMTYKVIALARLVCPSANIPSTTALATLNPERGRELGLQRGANVVMPNLTPLTRRCDYEIYPNKACTREPTAEIDARLRASLAAMGRTVGAGRGDSANFARRQPVTEGRTGKTE